MSGLKERGALPLRAIKLGGNEKGAVLLVSVVTLSLLTLAGLSTVEQTVVQERVAMNGRAAGGASLNSEKGLKQAVADLVAGDIFENGTCTGDAENDPANWRCEKSGDGFTYVVTYVMAKSGNAPATDENGDTIYKVSVAGVEGGASGGSFAADQLTAGVVLHDFESSEHPDYESLSEQCQSTYNPVTRKVTFCHATGASGHKLQSTDINGWLNGHKTGHGSWSDFCALDCSNGDPGAPVGNEGEVPSYTLMFYTRGDVEFYASGVDACENTGEPASSKSDSSKSDSSKSDSSKSDSSK
ncbi:MAG: pilus assembly PilX family protein, partial [Aequoribacter sp.]